MNVLREVERFLSRNRAEVVTIFVEDYVESPMGLTRVLNASGLARYMLPVWRMPKGGGDWPLLSDMVRDDHRLLVFTSKAAKEAAEGIAYEWRYVVENQCTYVATATKLTPMAFCLHRLAMREKDSWFSFSSTCRRDQGDGEGDVPQPRRVGRHGRPLEVAGARQLLQGPPGLP